MCAFGSFDLLCTGVLCCVQYAADGKWYRGVVKSMAARLLDFVLNLACSLLLVCCYFKVRFCSSGHHAWLTVDCVLSFFFAVPG